MHMAKFKVVFQPSGSRGTFEEGKNLRDAAHECGVELESICGGKGTCGKCKVVVQEGFFPKMELTSKAEHLSPLSENEKKKLKQEEIAKGYRLSCAAQVQGDLLIFVPEESRSGGQIVRKAARDIPVEIIPTIKKYYVELPPPTLHDPTGDLERLLAELKSTHKLENLTIDYFALRELSNVLRKGEWKVTATVYKDREIVCIRPGLVEDSYGLAVDVGTTTVVGYLTDLRTGKVLAADSMMNPQVQFGEDVMSRITYAMSNPDGLEKMNSAIIEGLNKIIRNVTAGKGIEAKVPRRKPTGEIAVNGADWLTPEDILEIVLVGNTCMHHLFLNLDPHYVGLSPFPPAMHQSYDLKARDMGLKANKAAYVHVLPIEAGFVGADNMGVVIATEIYNREDLILALDIGTNGEILLGNRKEVLSTSCATGPAFEGAHIKFGMRAAPGAIERVLINPETYEPEYKVIGKADWHTQLLEVNARGICGSGIIEAIAEMFKAGIIKKNGNFNTSLVGKIPRVRMGEDGPEYVLAWKKETSIGKDIVMNAHDMQAFQLAKGALYTGCKILMKRYGIKEVDKIILAGAFGSYIDKESSMVVGLYPDCDLSKVESVGNAAGDGARVALVNARKREEANGIARKIRYVELALDPDFQKEFMYAMFFPHMKDKFPHIQNILDKIPKVS